MRSCASSSLLLGQAAVSSAARAMPRALSTLRDARARFVRGGKGAGIGSEGLSSRRRLVINLWSGPRCSSTSMMYAFAQRRDCAVVDEPLYAYYLDQVPSEDRPYKDRLMQLQSSDGNGIIRDMLAFEYHSLHGSEYISPTAEDGDAPSHVFYKHMAKHLLPTLDRSFLYKCPNIILIRHPEKLLKSYTRALGSVAVSDTGLQEQVDLFDELRANRLPVPIVCNDTLLEHPEASLRLLCSYLGIDWDERMLSWEKGGRPEDGIWADLWYAGTHSRTGFTANDVKNCSSNACSNDGSAAEDDDVTIDSDVLKKSVALYEKLHAHRIVV